MPPGDWAGRTETRAEQVAHGLLTPGLEFSARAGGVIALVLELPCRT